MNGKGKVCVLDLGYIGLPTASILATHGFEVIGVDVNAQLVEAIAPGLWNIFISLIPWARGRPYRGAWVEGLIQGGRRLQDWISGDKNIREVRAGLPLFMVRRRPATSEEV